MRQTVAWRRLGSGEPIDVSGLGPSERPRSMVWRGRRHRIRASEQWQPPAGDAPSLNPYRRYFQVVTNAGMRAVVSLDIAAKRWRMEAVLGRQGD
jgi:hypothetical protein